MTTGPDRSVLLVIHTGRPAANAAARKLAAELGQRGIGVRMLAAERAAAACDPVTDADESDAARGCELVVALGGDGTLLRAAELARPHDVPLVGINLGHVGFLTEVERSDIDTTAEQVVTRDYTVEHRLTLEVRLCSADGRTDVGWALNDVSIERLDRARVLDLLVAIDDRPLSRWACDGVVCATPTGSTAYAFSAGGPVVWPTVDALLVVPINAHALFARPLVVAPDSLVSVEIAAERPAVMVCDGRRELALDRGDRLEIRRSEHSLPLARLRTAPFTDRLVTKFQLPVQGWRGPLGDD